MKTRSSEGVLLSGLETIKRKNKIIRDQILENKINNMSNDNEELLNEMSADDFRDEVNRLRDLNKLLNDQMTSLREQVINNDNDNADNRLLRTLIDGFRAINIDAKIPKFKETDNPNQYLENLDKFYKIKGINNENKLIILETAFEGHVKLWFDTQRNSFTNFDDFKTKFLNEFYFIPIRVKIKSAWLAKRFEPNQDTLHSYFLGQVQTNQSNQNTVNNSQTSKGENKGNAHQVQFRENQNSRKQNSQQINTSRISSLQNSHLYTVGHQNCIQLPDISVHPPPSFNSTHRTSYNNYSCKNNLN